MRIVFLGPSLPRREAERLVKAQFRPPARQGDIFRALEARPSAIALIDGVFESSPSVWHHELVAAQACGVRVYGAASMGALRAAELPQAVIPIGEIAQRYLAHEWDDDAHVALLHADEASDFQPLTVPHVNVWATVRQAVRAGVLSKRRGAEVLRVSEAQFYQTRTWASLVQALRWPASARDAFRQFVQGHAVDLKAADARACLKALARAPRSAGKPSLVQFSSFVRRARLQVKHPGDAQARSLEDAGTRTLLLAEFARFAGLEADPRQVLKVFNELPAAGWADDERLMAAQAIALEALVLQTPEFFVADGPSRLEGYRFEAQRRKRRHSRKAS